MNRYFDECKDLVGLKKHYRALVLKLHPDKGGSHDDFVEMQKQYEDCLLFLPESIIENIINQDQGARTAQEEFEFAKRIRILVDELGLTIQISGDWIWILRKDMDALNRIALKSLLRAKFRLMALGFQFSKKHDAWFWFSHPPLGKGGSMTLDEMFNYFGRQEKKPRQL